MPQPMSKGAMAALKTTVIGLFCLSLFTGLPVKAGEETGTNRHVVLDRSYTVEPYSEAYLEQLQAQLESVRVTRTDQAEATQPTTHNQSDESGIDALMQALESVEEAPLDLPMDASLEYGAVVEEDAEIPEEVPLVEDAEGVEEVEKAPSEEDAESGEAVEEEEQEGTDFEADQPEDVDGPEAPAADPTQPPTPREVTPAPNTLDANRDYAERFQELQEEEGQEISSLDGDQDQMLQVSERGAYDGDPLLQPVTIDFRDMELSNVVALLAHKAGINVIAGIDLQGTVTANLREVPLRQAMETALRMNGLGLMEEDGIYHIVSYEEAQSAKRKTVMVHLEEADVTEVSTVLNDVVSASPDQGNISITANEHANMLIIGGPEKRINDLMELAQNLDVAEVVTPTVTEIIYVNFSEVEELSSMIENMMLSSSGEISADERAKQIIVKDIPVVVEQIREFVKDVDIPEKQVNIDAMVLDVVLEDDASTGVDWILDVLREQDPNAPLGQNVGNLQELVFESGAMNIGNPTGLMSFGILTDRFDWRGIIQAELQSSNTNLVSNPQVIAVQNEPATITISQEIPYVELTQTDQGGTQTSTQFKDIGTILEVTPQITHNDNIIAEISGKESNTAGVFNDIPIENKREIETTTRVKSGQTIFMGGLRKNSDTTTVRKIPVLGDLPVINVLFRQNIRDESATELLIFLTCTVVQDDVTLSDYQQQRYDIGDEADIRVNSGETVYRDIIDPAQSGNPLRGIYNKPLEQDQVEEPESE